MMMETEHGVYVDEVFAANASLLPGHDTVGYL